MVVFRCVLRLECTLRTLRKPETKFGSKQSGNEEVGKIQASINMRFHTGHVKIGIEEHTRRVDYKSRVDFAIYGACRFIMNLQCTHGTQNRTNSTFYFQRLSDYGTLLSFHTRHMDPDNCFWKFFLTIYFRIFKAISHSLSHIIWLRRDFYKRFFLGIIWI